MDEEKLKKQIILKEISFWKSTHLLPEQYCDYLTHLYTGGESVNEEQQQHLAEQSILNRTKSKRMSGLLYVLFALITMVTIILMFLFAQRYAWVPLVFGIVIFIVVAYFIMKTINNPTFMTTFAYATAALLLFAISVKIAEIIALENNALMYATLILNCALWIVVGSMKKLVYFTISGILGLLVIIGYCLFF